jgi:hypothetical protein
MADNTHHYNGDVHASSTWMGDNAVTCSCGAEYHFATQGDRLNACEDLAAHIKNASQA